MAKHENTGRCMKCLEIINRYPGFNQDLKRWFEGFQERHPEGHTSCAGRDQIDQEAAFQRGASRARWGASAHNFGAALDLFVLDKQGNATWPALWFDTVLAKELMPWMTWYGAPGALFPERGHVEVKDWKIALVQGKLTKVA